MLKKCENCSKNIYGRQRRWCSQICQLKYAQRVKTANNNLYKYLIELLKEYLPSIFINGEIDKAQLEYIKEIIETDNKIKEIINGEEEKN